METERENLFLEGQDLIEEIDSLNAQADKLSRLCQDVSSAANERHNSTLHQIPSQFTFRTEGSKTQESFFQDWAIV